MSHEQEQTTQPPLLTAVESAAKKLIKALEADTRFSIIAKLISESSPRIRTAFSVVCNGVAWQIDTVWIDEDCCEAGFILYDAKELMLVEHSIWLKSDQSPNGYELMLETIVEMSDKAAAPQEPKLADYYTPIEHAINFGNWYRKRIHDDLNIRRDSIATTPLNTPSYQATLNCMEADLLTALATVIQDYIERMTNELELERQRKEQLYDDFSNSTLATL
jgi:hypothetical protein